MKRYGFLLFLLVIGVNIVSLGFPAAAAEPVKLPLEFIKLRETMIGRFPAPAPKEWGERVSGVKNRLATDVKMIALTLDACGINELSMGYDAELIQFLVREQIPATLFLSTLWIKGNPGIAANLAANPLFEMENHGLQHRPASTTGRSVYGLPGTANVGELVDEVELGARQIRALTGKKPKFYRAGTAYYDEVAIRVVEALGYQAVNFNVLGDAGATYKRDQVHKAVLQATPGSIIICHMNHPEGETFEGLQTALIELRNQGFRFVKLEQFPLAGR